jgi:hypothetical protein
MRWCNSHRTADQALANSHGAVQRNSPLRSHDSHSSYSRCLYWLVVYSFHVPEIRADGLCSGGKIKPSTAKSPIYGSWHPNLVRRAIYRFYVNIS